MTAIRVEEVLTDYEEYRYRTSIKFGGVALDRVTLLNVHCRVRTRAGRSATGFASMPLGNVWAFPSKKLSYEKTLGAMKSVAEQVAPILSEYKEYGHPIDIAHALEPKYHKGAEDVCCRLRLSEPIPPLATLVSASPFDAAVHDAFGKVHGLNCYQTYGRDFLPHDLSHYLGPEYRGLHLEQFIDRVPRKILPVYHLVGALDAIVGKAASCGYGDDQPKDSLPNTLSEWIVADGLTHLKIKLNGDDLTWDVDRVVTVERVAAETQKQRRCDRWYYSLDFNERCQNVAYLLEFLSKVQDLTPEGFARIQYIEQPTARDLAANRANTMHEAAKVCPVVIDESLIDLESLKLAQEMGYTGAALKACKGQSQALLMAAAAQHAGMFLCVQDLTCPGASLIQSAGLAAHVPSVAAIEANARQYVPAANAGWEARFPGVFTIRDGVMATGQLTGMGLGAI
jgi:L-alanine-DL-glutamate epimerase-like enolase superfamily enzyme